MPHADQVRIRSRWLPGWQPGRRGLAWLIPVAGLPGLRQLANGYQYALVDLPGFDLVPLEWMHILVQDVGFEDELGADRVDPLAESARKHLASTDPLTLSFHQAVVLPESLALPAEPQSALDDLRATLRRASADVIGEDLPGEPDGTDRHPALAYSSAEGTGVFAAATVGAAMVEPATAKVGTVSLVRLSRDHSCTEWETLAEVPLGG